jgi:hypothetical protein
MLELLKSKKFQAALVALVVSAVLYFIPVMPEMAITEVLLISIAFIIGQGLADFGKAGVQALAVDPLGLFKSKKFQAALVGMAVCIGVFFVPALPEEAATQVAAVFVTLILGQGLADFGKVAGLFKLIGGLYGSQNKRQ